MHKVIISVAPVQAGTPVDAVALAKDVAKCVEAGAAMCHLHCRTPKGDLTADTSYLSTCFDEILSRTDVILQASTGGVSDLTIEERCNPLSDPRVESTSLNVGSTNLAEAVYINSFEQIRYCEQATYDRGVIPEIEVFDIGMIHNVEYLKEQEKLPFRDPVLFNLVFGHRGGMQPKFDSLAAFRSFVPSWSKWGVTHYGRDNWNFLAAAIAAGATIVRIGFEDSHYLEPGKEAVFNYELVEKLVNLIHSMDFEVATPKEAREIMGILKKS